MKAKSPSSKKILVSGAALTRARAEKISAVEGMKLSPRMAAWFMTADKQGLTPEEKRAQIRAEFAKKP
jgi:hypothetical protein